MAGQIGDAIATPIVGFVSDKFLTKRKFHIIGSVMTFVTFPLIFAICPFCDIFPQYWTITYYFIVIIFFQIGWPTTQISHLAIITELSRLEDF
jgi:Na+/melibiose symporter-like transporter